MPVSRVKVNVGDRYAQLVVVRELPSRKHPSGGTKRWVQCRCDCGAETEVRLGHLRSGHTQSCGCVVKDSKDKYTHLPEYRIWIGIKKRCYQSNARSYQNYGGRGIRVCERWRTSFMAFYEDMGPRPSTDHQIDRIDGGGHYAPNNCRWATRKEQNRNRKDNRMLTFRGETMCLTDWAKRLGMRKGTLYDRLKRGLSVEEALGTPVRQWTGSK